MKAVIVQTTCVDSIEAHTIANVLLKKGLAACIQIADIESFYQWKGEICNDTEKLLSIKTKKENFEKIKRKIKEIHSYDLPEIICIEITDASKKYLKFIDENS